MQWQYMAVQLVVVVDLHLTYCGRPAFDVLWLTTCVVNAGSSACG